MSPRLRIVARIGLPRSAHGKFVLGSLAAHVLFAAILLLVPALRPKPTFDDTYFVQLAPALPGESATPPAPARPQPRPPEPKPAAEGVHVAPAEPQRVEPEKPKPKPKPVEPEPVAAPPSRSPDLEPDETDDERARAGGLPGAGAEAGGARIDMVGGDDALAWYRASVTSALYSHWQRPILTGNVETLEVTVDFQILRDGGVSGLQVTAGSGVPSLDRSALRAVSDASPLPPLPAQWKDPTLPARFIFQLHPEGF